MAEPLVRLCSVAAPLLRDNIDTDVIIPSREMKSVGKSGLADGLFAGWRYRTVGSREPDPSFVLNQPAYAGSQILLAGSNFGCGSSREHAVWALAEYGIRAILAPSFAPIFEANCVRNGVLPARLSVDEILRIAARSTPANGPASVRIDVAAGTVECGGEVARFVLDDEAREMLLGGLDPIALTLAGDGAQRIEAWLASDRVARPWIYTEESP